MLNIFELLKLFGNKKVEVIFYNINMHAPFSNADVYSLDFKHVDEETQHIHQRRLLLSHELMQDPVFFQIQVMEWANEFKEYIELNKNEK